MSVLARSYCSFDSQGIGSALMAPMLERCDREGVRAYLDATSERN
jgi:hypothetical protein